MQCYTQGCENEGRTIQLLLSHVPEEVIQQRTYVKFASAIIYMCVSCQTALFNASYDTPTTAWEIAVPARP